MDEVAEVPRRALRQSNLQIHFEPRLTAEEVRHKELEKESI